MFNFLKFFKKKKKVDDEGQNPEEKDQKVEDESILKEIAAQKGEKEKKEEPTEEELSPQEKEKLSRLNKVKSKIAQMLKSSNVEIIDENEGDEYEYETGSAGDKKKQEQDYDALKARFGAGGKNKKEELTLTIDDFDYTYIGKYVDEYDIIHMRDIKRIKLPNKHKKLIKRLSFAAAAIVVIVVASIITYNIVRVKPEYLQSVSLSQATQTYYKNEYFDYTGIYMVAKYSTGRVARLPLTASNYVDCSGGYVEESYDKTLLRFTGGSGTLLHFEFDGFVGESNASTSLILSITIVEKKEDGLNVMYSDGIFDLKSGDLINSDYLLPLVEYQDYNDREVYSTKLSLSDVNIKVIIDGNVIGYDSVNKGFVVESDILPTSKIEVSYYIKGKDETVVVELDRTKNNVSAKVG